MKRKVFAVLAGSALLSVGTAAQEAANEEVAPLDEAATAAVAEAHAANDTAVADPASPPAPRTITVPRLTPLVIELLATLSSETSVQGDHFPLRLFEPLVIDGETVIPAGTMGEGEVIHAKHKGGMGAAGELIITARFLDLNGQRIALRSLRVNGDGQSRIDTVNSIAMASAATIPLASLVGFFITGGAKTINEGTVAMARTAEDFDVPAPEAPVVPAAEDLGVPPPVTAPVEQEIVEGSQSEGNSE